MANDVFLDPGCLLLLPELISLLLGSTPTLTLDHWVSPQPGALDIRGETLTAKLPSL